MVTIRLNTWINAPLERCFQLATSIEFHIASAKPMQERAVAGVTAGCLREGQTVTWQGKHFGLNLNHTTRMDVYRPFSYFREVMVAGVFAHYEHEHHFALMDDGTRVRDEIRFKAPLGVLGEVAERLVLRQYITSLLAWRNAALKRVAESEDWRKYLGGTLGKASPAENSPADWMQFSRGGLGRVG